MTEIIVSSTRPRKLEYTARITAGSYESEVAFDCLLEEEKVEITFPDETELIQHIGEKKLEELKIRFWKQSRLPELFNQISLENREPRNSDFKMLLEKFEE